MIILKEALTAIMFIIFSSVFLLPERELKPLGMIEFANRYHEWLEVILLLGICFLLSHLILKTSEWVYKKYKDWQHDRYIRRTLESLPQDELLIILEYTQAGKNSRMYDPHRGAVLSLVNKGILYQSSEVAHRQLGVLPYTVTRAAEKYMHQVEFQKILNIRRVPAYMVGEAKIQWEREKK